MTRIASAALILALLSACATVETSTRTAPFDLTPLAGGAEGDDLARAYASVIPAPEEAEGL
jgi:hypothetical protein